MLWGIVLIELAVLVMVNDYYSLLFYLGIFQNGLLAIKCVVYDRKLSKTKRAVVCPLTCNSPKLLGSALRPLPWGMRCKMETGIVISINISALLYHVECSIACTLTLSGRIYWQRFFRQTLLVIEQVDKYSRDYLKFSSSTTVNNSR